MANNSVNHIVVLMMENRSFDHMLGALKETYPKINGLTGNESNPDTTGAMVKVQKGAKFQGQLGNDPDHHFPGVDLQIYGGSQADDRVPNMQGFVQSYFTQTKDVKKSHAIMNYFTPDQLPVLTTLATEFAVFNGWFSSIPGPTICNRAFAHYGTSYGQVGMDIFYILDRILSIYERMVNAGKTSKIYYYDQQSSTMEIVNLLKNEPQLFATFDQFLADCKFGLLPQYSFIEPCYSDHAGDDGGEIVASDQHPDHDVREGERLIATVFNAIRTNQAIWESTALLIVYDEHGGIYDHVAPPACTPDGYTASAADTGTGRPFAFDRLGIRVPAVLVSPLIPRGTVIPRPEDPANARNFEHASIPATVTDQFLPGFDQNNKRTVREQKAATFLDVLTGPLRPDDDCVVFDL
jgi:phospholipase C